jgi:hypothetical protein
MASQRGVTLVRQPQQRLFVPNRGEGFRLRIDASQPVDMVAEIFLHQRELVDPKTGEQQDTFVCVCSCFDLTIYPANEPDPTQFPQFFRKDHLDIILPGQSMAIEAWTAIYHEVLVMIESLNKLDVLQLGAEVRCGEQLPLSITETIGD